MQPYRPWTLTVRLGFYCIQRSLLIRRQDCLASLSIAETKTRIAQVKTAHEATFDWLYDPEIVSFSNWLRNDGEQSQRIYWIQGKPGSGKSTLMKFAMKDPRTLELLGAGSQFAWTFAAFFFHDRGSAVQKSLLGMLQEIVDSIIRQLPRLVGHVVAQYRQLAMLQRTRKPIWSLESLTQVMTSIIEQREVRINLVLFLDALDEHEGDNDDLVRLIKDWVQRADGYYVNLKICLASRPWNVFRHNFAHGPSFAIHHYTRDDIRIYAVSRLNAAQGRVEPLLGPENFEHLAQQIIAKAQGVFIWVRLVADQLRKDIRDGTPYKTLVRRVADTPEELEDLYDQTLARIDQTYAKDAHVMFQLVLYAFEPLPLSTLVRATEYSLDAFMHSSSLDANNNSDNESTSYDLQWLMSRSGGLLETYAKSVENPAKDIDNDHAKRNSELSRAKRESNESEIPSRDEFYVQFLHQTAKDYIQSTRANNIMERMATSVAKKSGFYFLTLSCQSLGTWVAPIKVHMFRYAKIVEVRGEVDARIHITIGRPHSNFWDVKTSLSQLQPSEILVRIYEIFRRQPSPSSENEHSRTLIPRCFQLTVMVAANLLFMVDRDRLSFELRQLFSEKRRELKFFRNSWMMVSRLCLLQLAIGGPDIVPTSLQDRAGMVQKLLSLGYPVDNLALPDLVDGF